MSKRIFIITGEYSGDMHAANVVKQLRELNSDIEMFNKQKEEFKNYMINEIFKRFRCKTFF